MPKRPEILFLSPSWPLGRTFGGQLRALHTARALQQLGNLTVTVVGSEALDESAASTSASEFNIAPPAATFPQHSGSAWERLRRAIDVRYLNVHGVVTSADDRARIASWFHRYDLIWVLNARTPNLLQVWHWPHSHLDVDDIPSTYVQRIVQTEHRAVQRLKSRAQRILLHRRERRWSDRFTTLSVCSDNDRRYLGDDRVHVISNGFARPESDPTPTPAAHPPRIGFIGLYSYPPNADALTWFLREVWPQVRDAAPNTRLRIVGKGTDGPLGPSGPGVDALGFVPDATEEISTWSAMIVPIRVGGGTRIKIAEAFARKCPLVSTSFGAYGYDVQHGRHLLLADDATSFASSCIRLVRDQEFGRTLAKNAWAEFLRKWTWEAITPKIINAAEDCLRRSTEIQAHC